MVCNFDFNGYFVSSILFLKHFQLNTCIARGSLSYDNKHIYRQSQVRKPTGSGVEWAKYPLIMGTGYWVQVLAWSSIYDRLHHMPADTIAKHVYEEMNKLHSMGFMTWVTRVNELIVKYDMDITKLPSNFRTDCKTAVIMQFKNQWGIDIQNKEIHPILRTYNKFKCSFGIEPYLNILKNINIEQPCLSWEPALIHLQLSVADIQGQKSI